MIEEKDLKIINALRPLSALYGLGVSLRNKLFDWEVLKGRKFPIPVISVGNITVGGTGKTPHTEYLIRLLGDKYKLAVLSRGYKRKSKGFVLADENSNSTLIGDEPFQMKRKFPFITVAVDSNRQRGIDTLLALPDEKRPEVILLDDAFQHRYVTPSLSILLIDSNRIINEDCLLPAGKLRESPTEKRRAEIVILTKCTDKLLPIDYRILDENLKLYPYQSLYFTGIQYGNLIPVFKEVSTEILDPKDLKQGTSILLVCGIANPEQIQNELSKYSRRIETLDFPDHHHFGKKDMLQIKKQFDALEGENKLIVVTEKDAVRLIDSPLVDEELKQSIYYLPIEVDFRQNQEANFNKQIISHIENFKRNKILQ